MMELIDSITVGSGGIAQIDLVSIPADFTDLVIVASLRSEYPTTTAALNLRINNQVSGVYSGRMLYGTGSSATSGSHTNSYALDPSIYIPGSTSTANTFGNTLVYLPNYTSGNTKRLYIDTVGEGNITNTYAGIYAGSWNNTAAITQVNFITNGDFEQYSTVYLYGITKGTGGATAS